MSVFYASCPCCDGTIEVSFSTGSAFKTYDYLDHVPVDVIDQIEDSQVVCEECDKVFTLTAKVVTKKVLELGVKL